MASLTRVFLRVISGALVSAAVLFGGATLSFAQTSSTNAPNTPSQNIIALATVNITDAKILSQNGNILKLSFNISNREGAQTGVKYGVQLISATKNTQTIVDEQVYPDSLTLAEHSAVSKEITYTPPANLSGTYALFLSSKNESGFPFALSFVGNVTLTATVKGIEINPESCFLTVAGEKGSPHYTLRQGVDIAQNENLILSCTATNHSSVAVSAVPVFETRYRTAYGSVVPQTGGDANPISFSAGQKKSFSIVLPKAENPQAYEVLITLKTGEVLSNMTGVHYVIRGASATIQNVSLDKNYYTKGDTAVLSLVWTPSADTFPNSRLGTHSPSATVVTVTMSDGSGNACLSPMKESLSANMQTKLSLPVSNNCSDPRLNLTLLDAQGNILAQQELVMTSSPMTSQSATSSRPYTTLSIVALGILVVLGVGAYMLRRKQEVPPYIPPLP